MNVLLDTHVFIWYVEGSNELSRKARNTIENEQNQCFVSMASLWEMSIKVGLNKLELQGSFSNVLQDVQDNGFERVPITFPHVLLNAQLDWHHKDPFDRLLTAQSIEERMDVISRDDILDKYFINTSIHRIW